MTEGHEPRSGLSTHVVSVLYIALFLVHLSPWLTQRRFDILYVGHKALGMLPGGVMINSVYNELEYASDSLPCGRGSVRTWP